MWPAWAGLRPYCRQCPAAAAAHPRGRILEVGKGSEAVDQIPGLATFISTNPGMIRTELGRFGRQISGYSLEHLLPESGRNVAAALTGTGGTCGIILEAEVDLTSLSTAPALAVMGYPDLASAADAVPGILPRHLLALEGPDAALVETIQNSSRSATMPALPAGAGWLMVDIAGSTDTGALDYVVLPSGPEAKLQWQVRSDGAGLAGRAATGEQAWPRWEDSTVPPEHLGDYLFDLHSLMEDRGLTGLASGHFGDGCVHLRIDFPLATQPAEMLRFLDAAARLVSRYGGSLSGEHGDGRARGELLETMYPTEAIQAIREFKALFDPTGLLNPGVVVDPEPIDASLRRPQAASLLASDGFASSYDDGDITSSVHRCLGVGTCRVDLPKDGGFMCPSFQATRDEGHSTRGKARVLQEMLNGGIVEIGWASPEVHEALGLCLSCKACANDCPTGIDMAMYKSEALFQTYKGKLRPLAHYTFGCLPQRLKLVGPFGSLLNRIAAVGPLRRLLMSMAGAASRRRLSAFPDRPFRMMKLVSPTGASASPMLHGDAGRMRGGPAATAALAARVGQLSAPTGSGHRVLLWVDSFADAMAPPMPSRCCRRRAAISSLPDRTPAAADVDHHRAVERGQGQAAQDGGYSSSTRRGGAHRGGTGTLVHRRPAVRSAGTVAG